MDLFEEIVRMRREGRRGALATIVHTNGSIPSYESSRMLVRDDGSIAGTIGGGCVEAEVWAAAKEVMQAEAPRKMTFSLNNEADYDNGLICGGTLEIFVEPILPQPKLYIFGGGHISMALAQATHAAGFAVSVVDDRESFANAKRFPMAEEIYTTLSGRLRPHSPERLHVLVIVTRGHRDDMRVLEWAVGTPARYIGMIGSKRKVLSVYRALEEKAGLKPEAFDRVYAPVGSGYRRAHAGRNRHQHRGGTHRRAARRRKSRAQIHSSRASDFGPGRLRLAHMLAAVILSGGAIPEDGLAQSAAHISRQTFPGASPRHYAPPKDHHYPRRPRRGRRRNPPAAIALGRFRDPQSRLAERPALVHPGGDTFPAAHGRGRNPSLPD